MANPPKDNPRPSADACSLYYFPEIPCGMDKGGASDSAHGHFVSRALHQTGDGSSSGRALEDSDQVRGLIEEAFGKGIQQGSAQTIAAQQESIDHAIGALKAVVEEVVRIRQREVGRMETETVRLALAISKKVIGHATECEPVIDRVVKAAMKKVTDPRQLTVRLNPKDIDTVKGLQRELLMADDVGSVLRLEADAAIQRGGCIIETKLGDVDARIDQQIKLVEEMLADQLPKNPLEG